PIPIARDALERPRGRCIVERGACAIDVRVGDRYIAGLIGLAIDRRPLAHNPLDRVDELGERDRLRATEVVDLVRARLYALDSGDGATDDVIDKRVVAARATVAVQRDRL